MDIAFEQKVRERAYQMWVAAGMADGLAHEHWCSAEQAVKTEIAPPAKANAAAKTVKRKTAQPKVVKTANRTAKAISATH